MNEPDTLKRTLERTLDELGTAILLRRALVGMESAKSVHGIDFFRLAYNAMFNDMIARAMKTLDRHKDSVGFWYVVRSEPPVVEAFVKAKGYKLAKYEDMADRLKLVRDKTHFHIDRKGVMNPSDVWKAADIKGSALRDVVDQVWEILHHVYHLKYGVDYAIPSYDGNDIRDVIALAQEARILYRAEG